MPVTHAIYGRINCHAYGRAMDSYVVRIYRRGGRTSRILIGTAEVAGAERKLAFSNIEELWGILGRRKGRDLCAPRFTQRCAGKEVRSGTDKTDL